MSADDSATPAPEEPADNPNAAGRYYRDTATSNAQKARNTAEVEQDLLTNPRYDAFFAQHHPKLRVTFARSYAQSRQLWTDYGDMYERMLEGRLTEFEAEATERLWDIQQKKLFDLQCRWRAEQVSVPGVVVSWDFNALARDIQNCTVVSPISEDELALYLNFLAQADYETDLHRRHFAWQDYDLIRQDATDDDADPDWFDGDVPEWYHFHNQHTGHDALLRLPNVRGEKEERYLAAWRADRQAAREAAEAAQDPAPPAPEHDPRPTHLYGEEERAWEKEFVRQFEPIQLRRQRDAYVEANPIAEYEDEELERVLEALNTLNEPVPIEAHPDWRRAILQAYYSFRLRKLQTMLPIVYQAYCQRQEWGISYPAEDDNDHGLANALRAGLLKGRRLLGEPENFDF
ncbi:hypothetical protein [Hymenobacter jeollabukensis]|uniref:Uncharacterized protein n=1 Tax=Hymenobacter jeollabukensis TaxID=2025313 RepID=A0A5R8WQI6_9BACT|nr:hypothetical protein [Hymenobacter jeollabukensis]TLM93007.1 hypothetical protein FDY95_10235 [Hymenobacter jeollabukensis]